MSHKNKFRLTQELLRSLYDVDPERGLLISRRRHHAGKAIGSRTKRGNMVYLKAEIGGHWYYLHRLIHFHATGEWPHSLDHHDRDGLNNRLANLIPISGPRPNSWNTGILASNKSGVPGVFWNRQARRWIVTVARANGPRHRGCFVNFADAVALRVQIEQEERGGLRHDPLVSAKAKAKLAQSA